MEKLLTNDLFLKQIFKFMFSLVSSKRCSDWLNWKICLRLYSMFLDISVVKLFHYFWISQQLRHISLMLSVLPLHAWPTSKFSVQILKRNLKLTLILAFDSACFWSICWLISAIRFFSFVSSMDCWIFSGSKRSFIYTRSISNPHFAAYEFR